jgi:hypothetical protein
MTMMEQYAMIDRVNRYTEQGWQFEPDGNRVRVYPPAEIREQLGLTNRAFWVAGASYQEALAFVEGFSECAWIVKRSRR